MGTTLDTDRLGDEIAELSAHLDAATHRLLMLIRQFDEAGGWADQGALSCAHWLSWRVGLELGAAREHVRVARAIADLPLVDDALRQGLVSYSKVRALTRVATPATEETLLEMARAATASQLERICRSYRAALRTAASERPEDEAEHRWVRERETEEGLVRFEVQVRPEEAAVVRRALESAMQRAWTSQDVPAGTPPASLRRADALVVVAEQYLAGSATAGAPPVEIVVHVDADTLADPDASGTLDDGTTLGPTATERLLCDATVVEVVEDSRGNVLDVGRRRRTIPTGLRRALRLRDRGCRFPGCTNRHVDGHHIVPWARGGGTALETCARFAGATTCTSTTTASASKPTVPEDSGSSARMEPSCSAPAPCPCYRPIRSTPCARGIGRPGSPSMRRPGFRAGTGGRPTTITPCSA